MCAQNWEPCQQELEEDQVGFWAVVQSTSHISSEQIWKKLERCINI